MKNGSHTNALLVEDDAADRANIRLDLEAMGLAVFDTACHKHAHTLFSERDYSVVLIHLAKAPLESVHLCRTFRAQSTVPIIMMTKRDEPVDEHMALLAGADDYIAKPIVPRLLTLRLATHVQRVGSENHRHSDSLVWGPLEIDFNQRQFLINGNDVHLTHAEFHFLHLLMTGPERVFTRDQILEAIGSYNGVGSDHIVDNHASRIRKKVREHGLNDVVKAVRSMGFRMMPLRELQPD